MLGVCKAEVYQRIDTIASELSLVSPPSPPPIFHPAAVFSAKEFYLCFKAKVWDPMGSSGKEVWHEDSPRQLVRV